MLIKKKLEYDPDFNQSVLLDDIMTVLRSSGFSENVISNEGLRSMTKSVVSYATKGQAKECKLNS